jgi:hypothetical protein
MVYNWPRGSVMNQHLLWSINGGFWRDREVGDVEQSKYYIYSPLLLIYK